MLDCYSIQLEQDQPIATPNAAKALWTAALSTYVEDARVQGRHNVQPWTNPPGDKGEAYRDIVSPEFLMLRHLCDHLSYDAETVRQSVLRSLGGVQ